MEKGTFGYINKKKKKQLIKALLTFSISFITLIVGYILNDNSNQNVFTIIAILIVLPATKILIGYIVVAPFRSVDKKTYEEVNAKKNEKDELFVDLVFTSTEKVMNLSFLMIKNGILVGFTDYKKTDITYMQGYLQRLVDGSMLPYKVKIEKDYNKYLKNLDKVTEHAYEDKDREELHKLIMSILV